MLLKRRNSAGVASYGSVSTVRAGPTLVPPNDGGAVCKGAGHCLVLSIECKGTYTDATDKNGTVYGKCSQTMQVDPKTRLKLAK